LQHILGASLTPVGVPHLNLISGTESLELSQQIEINGAVESGVKGKSGAVVTVEPFTVSIALFDGPLDLLLHLVKLHELPIEKISLGMVAEQFLDCVTRTQEIEVEIAGEYLVIASTLLSIKARYVLREPSDELLLTGDDASIEEDPHEALLRRLKELAVYKESAEMLSGRPMLGVEMFAVPALKGNRSFSLGALSEHDPMALGRALRAMAKKRGIVVPPLTFVVDSVSVGERMQSVLQVLTDQKAATNFSGMKFEDVVDRVANKRPNQNNNDDSTQITAAVLISCFLAILELCRRNALWIEQDEAFDVLILMLPIDAGAGAPSLINLASGNEQGDVGDWSSEFDGENLLEVLEGGRS
jgi:segregation and condensation protein A